QPRQRGLDRRDVDAGLQADEAELDDALVPTEYPPKGHVARDHVAVHREGDAEVEDAGDFRAATPDLRGHGLVLPDRFRDRTKIGPRQHVEDRDVGHPQLRAALDDRWHVEYHIVG